MGDRAAVRRVTWPEVLAAVQGDAERFAVTSRLREGGFSADSFARLIDARVTVAEALVRVEDQLEERRGSVAARERSRVQAVRRRLELELWP